MTNAINPSHYKSDTIECIDAMKACSTPEEFRGHLKLTVLKYLWREDKKGEGDQARVENLEKAAWYLDRLVKDLRGDVAEVRVIKTDKNGLSWTTDPEIPPHTINAADQGWIENTGERPKNLPHLIDIEWAHGDVSLGGGGGLIRWSFDGTAGDIKRWRPSK